MRKWLEFSRIAALLVAILCTPACVSAKWPRLDEERSHLVVVAGNFSGVHRLDEPPCSTNYTGDDTGFVFDCFSGPPSRSTFHVYEVVYGSLAERHPSVAYHAAILDSEVPPGEGKPVLTLLFTDGRHTVLGGVIRNIARTVDGDWAIPVHHDEQLSFMPCGALPLVRPLTFAHPQPSQSLEGIYPEAIEALRQNPRVSIDGGRFYITHGIPLRDIRQFMATVDISADDCDDES